MLDRHHNAILSNEVRNRPRWGSLANENSLLDLLEGNSAHLQPTALTLTSANSNLYLRRHSAHTCPTTEKETAAIPPEPIRPPAVPKRIYVPPQGTKPLKSQNIPPIPPSTRTRPLPPIPPARTHITDTTSQLVKNKHVSPKQTGKTAARVFEFNNKLVQEYGRLPPAPSGPPPPPPPTTYHKPQLPQPGKTSQPNNNVRMSIRQDSSLSSDSFSQTSSPSYTTKSMETPLLPPRSANAKPNGISNKIQLLEDDNNENTTITKSVSTPASLQTIVRFQNGSNMSLHHRIIKDMRRPSNPYVRRAHLRFRFAQVILNAVALLAIGGGMAAYFKAYPMEMRTVTKNTTNVARPIVIYENPIVNPAPGICLPVIVDFCQQHRVPYNFTVFPNFMGHFGQPEAQQELEVYDAVVDVRCYELAWLFLCSVFVPKCGPNGVPIGPCRSLCHETTRRCGFFLDVFGLELPDYVLKCDYFQDSENTEVCIGQREVIQEKTKASKAICPSGFQCDMRRCIPKDWHCDGHIDCKDQSDELNCENCGIGMIHCGADRCISLEHMCDGNIDCPWGQDERNCLRLSDHNGDEGRGQLEVFRPEQQQWVPACLAYWDPATSPELICSVLGYSNSNGSGVINGLDSYDLSTIHETTAIWRMHQNKRPRNLLKELTSCKPKMYSPTYLVCTNYICGRSKLNGVKKRNTRIVGGFASKPGDWPFLAALLGGPEEIFYCAGVLIADQWVLTASHCVGNHSDVSGWTIQLGITRRHAHSYYGQKMKVKRVVPHPKYNIGSAHDNDVALFQLTTHVTFHEHLMPVCLPSANKELLPGTICTVIGWGKKEDTGMSEYEPEINEVEVPVLNRDLCNSWLENRDLNVTDGMICAGYKEGGKDACQGDSGGPLLCRDDEEPDRWFVGGIVSWGIKCAHPHLPGVYAYVPKYIPWIKQQMELYSD